MSNGGERRSRLCKYHENLFARIVPNIREKYLRKKKKKLSNMHEYQNEFIYTCETDKIVSTDELTEQRQLMRVNDIRNDDNVLMPYEEEIYNYVKSNKNLFTVGGGSDKSVVQLYERLHAIIYNEEFYSCCVFESTHNRHNSLGISSFPKRDYQQIIQWSLLSNSTSVVAAVQSKRPMSGKTIARVGWYDDITIAYEDRLVDSGMRKLLDDTYEHFANAWNRIITIVSWSRRVSRDIGQYPVRRSIWDLMICKRVNSDNEDTLISNNLLCDVGSLREYILSLFYLMLIIYNSCCMTRHLERTVSSGKRVTYRHDNCNFPSKSSGIYYGLFQTSKLPHKLFCIDNIEHYLRDDDSLNEWIHDFTILYNRARERFNLNDDTLEYCENNNNDNNNTIISNINVT